MRRSSTGQEKCEGRCHPVPIRDFRVDSRLVRWALASCTRATPLKKPTLHCQEDCCTQPWGSGADGALTKGFSDLTIVGMDPSKTKYAPYCPVIRPSSVPAKMYIWMCCHSNALCFTLIYTGYKYNPRSFWQCINLHQICTSEDVNLKAQCTELPCCAFFFVKYCLCREKSSA